MTDHHLTEAQWLRLKREGEMPGGLGEMFQVACNVTPETSLLQARRIGLAGRGLESRVGIFVQDSEEMYATVYISAAEARQVAAHLLDAADEIDGVTPLAFFPRTPGGEEAPEAEEPVTAATVAGTSLVDFARITGDSAETGHSFEVGEPVQVLNLFITDDGLPCAACVSLSRLALVQIVGQADLDTLGQLGNDEEPA
jgi:hypothetical protein